MPDVLQTGSGTLDATALGSADATLYNADVVSVLANYDANTPGGAAGGGTVAGPGLPHVPDATDSLLYNADVVAALGVIDNAGTGQAVDWWSIGQQVEANFAATGHWFL